MTREEKLYEIAKAVMAALITVTTKTGEAGIIRNRAMDCLEIAIDYAEAILDELDRTKPEDANAD